MFDYEQVAALKAAERQAELDRARRGIITIGEHTIWSALELPPGYDVVAIWADPAIRGIQVLVRSDELEPVPPGAAAPSLSGRAILNVMVVGGKPWFRFEWDKECGDTTR